MICPDENLLADYLAGNATAEDREAVRSHMEVCVACLQLIAELARTAPARTFSPDDGPWEEPLHVDALHAGVSILRRFVLTHRLGAGGMGVVWSASEPNGHHVALKFLRSEDSEHQRRLLREARIARAIVHPSVVRVREVLSSPQLSGPVLVMDLVHGQPLEERLCRAPLLDVRETAALLEPVVRGVLAAHAKGIVHRDLTPRNILVEWDARPSPRAYVLDFGVAKILEAAEGESARITRSGLVVGTPQYMAPEQLFGERAVDHRADVWSMGAILYRCLAGVAPIAASSFGEVFKAITIGRIAPLREAAPSLPESVLSMVDSMLVRDRAQRLNDLGPVADTLAALLA